MSPSPQEQPLLDFNELSAHRELQAKHSTAMQQLRSELVVNRARALLAESQLSMLVAQFDKDPTGIAERNARMEQKRQKLLAMITERAEAVAAVQKEKEALEMELDDVRRQLSECQEQSERARCDHEKVKTDRDEMARTLSLLIVGKDHDHEDWFSTSSSQSSKSGEEPEPEPSDESATHEDDQKALNEALAAEASETKRIVTELEEENESLRELVNMKAQENNMLMVELQERCDGMSHMHKNEINRFLEIVDDLENENDALKTKLVESKKDRHRMELLVQDNDALKYTIGIMSKKAQERVTVLEKQNDALKATLAAERRCGAPTDWAELMYLQQSVVQASFHSCADDISPMPMSSTMKHRLSPPVVKKCLSPDEGVYGSDPDLLDSLIDGTYSYH